nr:flavodoxin [uncultured Trichococcus sp.]
MKNLFAITVALLLTVYLSACGREGADTTANTSEAKSSGAEVSTSDNSANILIAYFSVPEDVNTAGVDAVAGASVVLNDGEKMGNTEYVANLIQQTIGGDLFRIETIESYPLDHDPLVDQAADEQDDDARPELASHLENFDQYEVILLGFPNWWGDMPMPVYSFLEEYDFGSKTIIPFITHGGSASSDAIETISEIQPGALIQDDALVLSRNDVVDSEEEVISWAEGLAY